MNNNEPFIIRRYGKSELALLYMQGASEKAAMKLLNEWLEVNPRLRHLARIRKKYFTPKQVKLIVEEIGEPFDLKGIR